MFIVHVCGLFVYLVMLGELCMQIGWFEFLTWRILMLLLWCFSCRFNILLVIVKVGALGWGLALRILGCVVLLCNAFICFGLGGFIRPM